MPINNNRIIKLRLQIEIQMKFLNEFLKFNDWQDNTSYLSVEKVSVGGGGNKCECSCIQFYYLFSIRRIAS